MPYEKSNITTLIEDIKSNGVAFSNRYQVVVNTPSVFTQTNLSFLRSLILRCDSATIPGRSFSTAPFRYYGPARNMPYEQIYSGEVNFSFILSEDLKERVFFETWMMAISSPSNYKMGFYDDYTTTVEINVLNRKDICLFKLVLSECFPKALGDMQIGYDKDNDFMRQDVTMSFRKYEFEYYGSGRQSLNPDNPAVIKRDQNGEIGSLNAALGLGPNRLGPKGQELIEYLESQQSITRAEARMNREDRKEAFPLERWLSY